MITEFVSFPIIIPGSVLQLVNAGTYDQAVRLIQSLYTSFRAKYYVDNTRCGVIQPIGPVPPSSSIVEVLTNIISVRLQLDHKKVRQILLKQYECRKHRLSTLYIFIKGSIRIQIAVLKSNTYDIVGVGLDKLISVDKLATVSCLYSDIFDVGFQDRAREIFVDTLTNSVSQDYAINFLSLRFTGTTSVIHNLSQVKDMGMRAVLAFLYRYIPDSVRTLILSMPLPPDVIANINATIESRRGDTHVIVKEGSVEEITPVTVCYGLVRYE
jgi:hypothetical protein